jgi:hypothetical protein
MRKSRVWVVLIIAIVVTPSLLAHNLLSGEGNYLGVIVLTLLGLFAFWSIRRP